MQRTRRQSSGPRLPSPAPTRQPLSYKEERIRAPLEYDPPPKKDNLFLWTVFLLLLLGVACSTWIGVYVIFGQPDLPFSYKILRKFKRLDPPQRFKVNVAPQGEFVSSEKLFNRYNALTPVALRDANKQMERSYLRNYPISPLSAAYITGRFTIMNSYELGEKDFFPSGVVALAVSDDFPKLLIEHVYPAGSSIAPLIKRNLQPGMDIELRRTYELTTVLHATKLPEGKIVLTVVPLNYGSYIFKGTSGGFTLEPPPTLNVGAPWPILADDRRREANETYLNYRRDSGLGLLLTKKKEGEKPAETALKGVDAPIEPETTPTPSPAPALVASAVQAAKNPLPGGKKPVPVAAVAAIPAAAIPTPAPTLPPPVVAAATPPIRRAVPVGAAPTVLRAAPATGTGGVSLQPFLGMPASTTTSVANSAGGARTWQTYAPGRMPSGKTIRAGEIASLAQRGGVNPDQPLYLSGQFVVRAVGENKNRGIKNAVLRSTGADANVRVIAEYPSDRPLPSEGAEISRDESRPYQIIDVQQTTDGTFNVFVREIAEP